MTIRYLPRGVLAALALSTVLPAEADSIIDWNRRTGEIVAEARIGAPPAVRIFAIAQTSAYEAVRSLAAEPAVSAPAVDAAVAAAHRASLGRLLPAQKAQIDAAYLAALAVIPEGPARTAGVAAGERAASAVLSRREEDSTVVASADSYRPATSVGVYVPTVTPAVTAWPRRKPWLMADAAQFRPGPPPAPASPAWARDYNEVKSFGARSNGRRDAEQTEIARFWEYSLPPIYYGVVRSVADDPGRDTVRNARLFAAVAQAMDDAMISVFDAKYHYNFWRPVTAIRNGDLDGNDGTEREATWGPLIETPLHPEYPSAHSILAAAVGAVLAAEIPAGARPALTTASPTAGGKLRRWASVDELVREVADARIYAGIHFRTSTDVGATMGRRVGELAVLALPPAPRRADGGGVQAAASRLLAE